MTSLTPKQAFAAKSFNAEGFTVIEHATPRQALVIRNAAEKLGRSVNTTALPNGRMLIGPVGKNYNNSILWIAVRKLFQNWTLFINLVNQTTGLSNALQAKYSPLEALRIESLECELKQIVERFAWVLRKFPELVEVFEIAAWGYTDAKKMVFAEVARQNNVANKIAVLKVGPETISKAEQYAVCFVRACNPVTKSGTAREIYNQVIGATSENCRDLADIVISNLEAAGLVNVEQTEEDWGAEVDFPASHFYEAHREKSEQRMNHFARTGVR